MAVTKTNRSVHRAQLHHAHSLIKAARRNNRRASNRHPEKGKPAERRNQNHGSSVWPRKILRFPQTKDKTVEDVEFSTELGYHSISVNFKDKTSLNFAIDSSFTVETDYSNWKTGNQRVLHRWRPVQNVEFRDTIKKRKR